jgi:chromosome segregation ATPase
MSEEYEIVPLDPIRALEKRIEKLEQSIPEKTASIEFLELVKTNQQVVDDLVKMNSQVINRLLALSDSINNLVTKLNEFMNKFEIATSEESDERIRELEEENKRLRSEYEELVDRLSKIEKRINALLIAKLPIRRGTSVIPTTPSK